MEVVLNGLVNEIIMCFNESGVEYNGSRIVAWRNASVFKTS
jgi:hypothetical protein